VLAGLRIGEIAVPTRYFTEASSVNFRRSVVYGLATLRTLLRHRRAVRSRSGTAAGDVTATAAR
jgi:hypothetical protein